MNEGSGAADPLTGPRQQQRQSWIVLHNLLGEIAQLVFTAEFGGLGNLSSRGTTVLRPDNAGWDIDDGG
jgi:hypothetical protein